MKFGKLHALAMGSLMTAMVGSAQAVLIGEVGGNLYDYDVDTNTSALIGNTGNTMYDIALNPLTDILYGVSSSGVLYSIDQTDASTTFIGGVGHSVNGLTFNDAGVLYASGGSSLYTIDLGTGLGSAVGSGSYYSSGDIAFDDLGNLFLSSTTGPGDSLWLIDALTGSGSLIGEIGLSGVYGLNYTDDTLFGFTSGGTTLAINTSTGQGTFVSSNGIDAYGADGVGGVIESSVPEPSALFMLGLGLIGLAFRQRFGAKKA